MSMMHYHLKIFIHTLEHYCAVKIQKCQQQEPSFASDQSLHSTEAPGLSVILCRLFFFANVSVNQRGCRHLLLQAGLARVKINSLFNPIGLNEKNLSFHLKHGQERGRSVAGIS